MNRVTGPRKRQFRAYLFGAGLGLAAFLLLILPQFDALHARGPMNTGHDSVRCASCHKPAPGSPRQQIQANMHYVLGKREATADFIHSTVGNEQCLKCHERPNDRHPVYRFLEPRFAKAREKISPQSCVSCHNEHRGRRVTLGTIDYCRHCHEKTKLRKDPLDISHADLIALKQWDTCLGCHDFHGNHIMKTARTVEAAVSPNKILAYFRGEASPYGNKVRYPAKKEAGHVE